MEEISRTESQYRYIPEDEAAQKPLPSNFDAFVPWNCLQFQTDFTVVIEKVVHALPVRTSRIKTQLAKSQIAISSNDENISEQSSAKRPSGKFIVLKTDYEGDNLVKIKIINQPYISRILLKVINLAIGSHPHLNTIEIKGKTSGDVIYEISKFLLCSTITNICLDDTVCQAANYYLLLETLSNLRNLSLNRCRLNDDVIRYMAESLQFGKPASRSLVILSLSTNNITDIGAEYLAKALRTNRLLRYLNLADNQITDQGAASILNVLYQFPLTMEEVVERRLAYIHFLKYRQSIIRDALKDELLRDRKSKSLVQKKSSEMKGRIRQVSIVDKKNHTVTLASSAGLFMHPFDTHNTIVRNSYYYCLGNNALSYINFAYNKLSFWSLHKIQKVLEYQKLRNQKPQGLINVVIDGNNMPNSCQELVVINEIIQKSLGTIRSSNIRKKLITK